MTTHDCQPASPASYVYLITRAPVGRPLLAETQALAWADLRAALEYGADMGDMRSSGTFASPAWSVQTSSTGLVQYHLLDGGVPTGLRVTEYRVAGTGE